ncbi:hypothetical protein PC116_g21016 [Phytophthora cactorum]|nr:hypothetical protein PC116_g21016 [Phytophthora cactorum]
MVDVGGPGFSSSEAESDEPESPSKSSLSMKPSRPLPSRAARTGAFQTATLEPFRRGKSPPVLANVGLITCQAMGSQHLRR